MNEKDKLQNQFESYIKKWNVILDLSKRFNVKPDEITSFLFEIGLEALNKTEKVLSDEFKVKTKNILGFYRDFNSLWKQVKADKGFDYMKGKFDGD